MRNIELHEQQFEFLKSRDKLSFYVGGIGAGKTFVLGIAALQEASLPGSIGLITAPWGDTLMNSTLPGLQEAWYAAGIIEGEHYIIGNRPPKSWGVRAYTFRNSKILTWRWGAYSILDGADNYNKHRGAEFDYVIIDEFRDVKEGALTVFLGRLRGKAKKRTGGQYRVMCATTPPDNPYAVEQYAGKANIIYGSSYSNLVNLPPGYLDALKEQYDDITFRREVLGELIYLGGNRTYYCFDDANITQQAFEPTRSTVMAWDFNASPQKPMSTILIQDFGDKRIATAEFIYKGSNTYRQCEAIETYLNERKFTGELVITGDYSGHRSESNATRSDYAIIEQYFRNHRGYRQQTRPTLSVRDRVASLNAQFRNQKGERKAFIAGHCTKLIEDLRKVVWSEDGMGLDGTNPERTHPTDALSYWAYNFAPIDRKEVIIR